MKQRANITGWTLTRVSNGFVLRGNVTDHPKLEGVRYVLTSRLISIDFDNNKAETTNTIYELGEME